MVGIALVVFGLVCLAVQVFGDEIAKRRDRRP
jgi:hypothetical protein